MLLTIRIHRSMESGKKEKLRSIFYSVIPMRRTETVDSLDRKKNMVSGEVSTTVVKLIKRRCELKRCLRDEEEKA